MQNPRFRVQLDSARRQRACLTCRQRKRKCDGNRPACSACTALGRASECHYGQPSEMERSLASKVSELEKQLKSAAMDKSNTCEWWELDDIPSEMSDFLITTFTRHASQFNFDQMMPSFLLRLNLYPPAHPSYPHASLLNAIYLIASSYLSAPSYPPLLKRGLTFDPASAEPIFLKRTRMALSDNLAFAVNLLDFLHASGLLGRYFYYLMRQQEGHFEGAGAVQIAMACNLHKISSATDLAAFPPSLLPSPTDTSELLDRINSFWFIFVVDQMGSVVSGLPASFPDEVITTVFPPPVKDPSTGEPYQYLPGTAATLMEAGSTVASSAHDTLHGLKAKGTALVRKVRDLSIRAAQHGPKPLAEMPLPFTMDYFILTNAINQFHISLPPLPSSTSVTPYGSALAELALPATVCRAASMQLCRLISAEDEEAHKKMLHLAKEIVDITHMVEKVNETWWHVPIQMAWGNTCEVYQQEIAQLLQSDSTVDIYGTPKEVAIKSMRRDMKFLARMTRRLMKVYRAHQSSLDFIEGVLAMDSEIRSQFSGAAHSSPEDPSDTASSTSAAMEEIEAPPLKWIEWLGRPRPRGSHQAEKNALKNMQRAWKLPQPQ